MKAQVARDVQSVLSKTCWKMLPVNLVQIMRTPAHAANRQLSVCVILVSVGQTAANAPSVLQASTSLWLPMTAVLLVQQEHIRHSGAPRRETCASLVPTNLTRLREIELSLIARVLPVIRAQMACHVSHVLLESTRRFEGAQTVRCARQARIRTILEHTLLTHVSSVLPGSIRIALEQTLLTAAWHVVQTRIRRP